MWKLKNKNCMPVWADKKIMLQIYHTARRMRSRGYNVEVDHIVPLNNPRVCGLHVENNLRIIRRAENLYKSNHHWPDMPNEQLELDLCRQLQLRLIVS